MKRVEEVLVPPAKVEERACYGSALLGGVALAVAPALLAYALYVAARSEKLNRRTTLLLGGSALSLGSGLLLCQKSGSQIKADLGAVDGPPIGAVDGGRYSVSEKGRIEAWRGAFEKRRGSRKGAPDYPAGNPLYRGAKGEPISHDSTAWLNHFGKFFFGEGNKAPEAGSARVFARGQILDQTLQAIEFGYVITEGDEPTKLDPGKVEAMIQGTKVYYSRAKADVEGEAEKKGVAGYPDSYIAAPAIPEEARGKYITQVEVVEEDCCVTARESVRLGYKTVLMDASNRRNRGGNPSCAGAQEEYVCRTSTLYPAIDGFPHYPTPEFGVLHLPGVQVFRGKEAAGYPFQEPFEVDVIAAAAYSLPSGKPHATYEEDSKEILRVFFRTAYQAGAKAIVLTAWGCGAFRNDPTTMAALMRSVLEEDEMKGVFPRVYISIIEDHNSPLGGNVAPFRDAFQAPLL